MEPFKRLLTILATYFALFAPPAAFAQPFAYITNEFDGTVSVINTATNTITGTVPVGAGPFGVAVSSDGSRIYVANTNDDTVSVIDGATNSIVTTVSVGAGPYGVAVSPDETRVYVANASNTTVSVIDGATNSIVTTVSVEARPLGVAVTPDGTRVYVANASNSTVSVIDTATNGVVATLNVGSGPVAFGDFIGPLTGEVQFLGLSPSKLGIYRAGDTITFTATAIGPEPIYYKFWYREGYGTPAYATNPFIVMQDFSISNSATHTFTAPGNYIVLVWGTDDPNNVVPSGVPIMGMNIKVEN